MNFRNFLLKLSIPVTKLIAAISRPAPRITSQHQLEIRSHIRNGDVLVSYTAWELSNIFLPGRWKHCGVYINGWVYESTTHDVRKVLLEEFCLKKDRVGICRLWSSIFENRFDYLLGIPFLEENLGEPYDYGFRWGGNASWYCSKYVYNYLRVCDFDFFTYFELRETLGEPTVTPTDYWLARKFFSQVYEC